MKRQILFSEQNKKHISICRLLKFLPKVLGVITNPGFSGIGLENLSH